MKNNAIFILAALALLSGLAFSSLSIVSTSVVPATLKPGDTGAVQITLQNTLSSTTTASGASTTDLQGVQVFFGDSPGIHFTISSPVVLGTIGSGASAIATIPFQVLQTAKGGTLSAQFTISQKDVSEQRSVVAVIPVENPAILTLASDKQVIGATDEINLTIRNNGGAASRATLNIGGNSKFVLAGTTQVYIGDISGTTTVAVPIDARAVDDGVSSIPFVISYQAEGGTQINETKSLTVTVKKEKADVAFTQVEPIVTNKDNTLKMTVKNKGRALSDFRVLLTDANVQSKDNSQISLGNLATGEEKSFEIPVFVNEQPGVKTASFDVKWAEDSVEKEETFSVPLVISSDAEVGIYLDAKPTPLAVGGDYTLSATVSNLGSYKIANVVVALDDNKAFDILNIQQEQYIGNLDNDAFSTVQYKIRVKGDVLPGQYPLVFQVRYKDQSGIWIDKNVTTVVSIRPASEGVQKGGDGTIYIIIAVVLIGGGYWYFKMRKPKTSAK